MKFWKLASAAVAIVLSISVTTASKGDVLPEIPIYVPLFEPDYIIYNYIGDGSSNVNVSGASPGAGYEDKIYAHFSGDLEQRPGLQQLEEAAKQFVAEQLGVDVTPAFVDAARGQIKALVYIRLMAIIQKPAADRTAQELNVYNEIKNYIAERRTLVTNLAAKEYNKWRDSPCTYQVPAGDNPNLYLDLYEMVNYCSSADASIYAAIYSEPLAIPSELYLGWATEMRSNLMLEYWADNYCYYRDCSIASERAEQIEIWKQSLANGYLETERAMAFHQGAGELLSIPGLYFTERNFDDTTLAEGMQSVLSGFATSYVRDFLGTVLLTALVTGPSGLVPDPHDLAIIATVIWVNTWVEFASHIESRQGITDVAAKNNESLETIVSTPDGRAELVMALEELAMPDDLRGIGASNYEALTNGTLYTEGEQNVNTILVKDWGENFLFEDYPNAQYGYNTTGLFSRLDANTRFRGHASHIRFTDDIGDYKTAWLVNSGASSGPQVLITEYAKRLTNNQGTPAEVTVQRLFNNDCPLGGTYSASSNPTDHGLSCVQSLVGGNGVMFAGDLNPGDTVIVAGKIVKVKEIISPYAFTTQTELGGGYAVPVHKVIDPSDAIFPANRFQYLAEGSSIKTAIFDPSVVPPTISIDKPEIIFEAYAAENQIDLGTVTAIDLVDGEVEVISDAPASFPLGTTIVTYTATDSSSNTVTATQMVNVVDTIGPEFDLYPSVSINGTDLRLIPPALQINVEATGLLTKVILEDLTASDPSGVISISNNAPENGFPLGFNTVKWTATDANGNTTSLFQTVYVRDTIAPVFTFFPSAINIEAMEILTSVDLGMAAANDIFDVTISNDAPADGFSVGVNVVTWTATDANGNTSTATQNVTVVDTTPPVFTSVPTTINTEATSSLTKVVLGEATASDIFAVTVTNDAPVGGFSVGTHSVSWTATDANGNSSMATQVITVVDTTPPTISIIDAAINVEATAVENIIDLGNVTAMDLVDGVIEVTSDAPVVFPLGITTVTYTAIDSHGNSATSTQSVNVVDTTAPVISTVPADIDSIALAEHSNANLGQVEATDIFPVSITNDAPAVFSVGTTLVTWTVTDTSGNSSTATQKVTFSYQFEGFMKPIENGGIYKNNRVLPLRFQLTYADGSLVATAQATLTVYQLSNGEVSGDGIEISSVGNADSGSNFRVMNNQYVYNLNARNTEFGVYRLLVNLNDGKSYSIDIALK